jgi:glycosyltransferase involved in cell wall biosynthesis
VTAAVVDALLKNGHQVVLHTTRSVNLEFYRDVFKKDITRAQLKVHKCALAHLSAVGGVRRYANLACEFGVRYPMRGDAFVDLSPGSCLGATYVRLPDIAYWNPPVDFRSYFRQVLDGPLRRVAFTPLVYVLMKLLERMNEIPLHFVNSMYSEKAIRECYDGRFTARMQLLYPPVRIKDWAPPLPMERNGVISVARFSPWKRHEMQLHIVGDDIPLTMIGGARDQLEIETVKSLQVAKGNNVKILANQPIENLRQLLWSSKVFLHTAESEPFGLSIVEAIAAGNIPVIRRLGGAAEIVPFSELTFTSPEEAREIVEKALVGDYDHYVPRLLEHIAKFDESVFCSVFTSAVERIGR